MNNEIKVYDISEVRTSTIVAEPDSAVLTITAVAATPAKPAVDVPTVGRHHTHSAEPPQHTALMAPSRTATTHLHAAAIGKVSSQPVVARCC